MRNRARGWWLGPNGVVLVFCLLTGLSLGQDINRPPKTRSAMPEDWSTRHVIYTNGASPATASALQRDPRAWYSWLRRSQAFLPRPQAAAQGPLGENAHPGSEDEPLFWGWHPPTKKPRNTSSRIDWSVSLGPTGGVQPLVYPAKFSFDVTATPDCTNDFVVFPINATPHNPPVSPAQANIVALNNLYTGTSSTSCGSPLTAPTFLWSYGVVAAVGPAGVASSPTLSLDGTKVAFVDTNTVLHVVTWAANANTYIAASGVPGATESGCTTPPCTVTITTTTPHGLSGTPNVTVGGVGVAGYNGNFTVTSVPTATTFTYTDSTASLADSGGGYVTTVPGQGTSAASPVAPGSVADVDYSRTTVSGKCTANGISGATQSVFVDYTNDFGYTVDPNGRLYQITTIFTGTPTLTYCTIVNSGVPLTSPVYDYASNQVFVSDGEYVYAYAPPSGGSGFTLNSKSPQIGASACPSCSIQDAPIVDSTNGFVYVVAKEGVGGFSSSTVVSQLQTSGLTQLGEDAIGPTSNFFVADGQFDNNYYVSGPKSGSGTLYVAGANGSGNPALFAITFSSGTGQIVSPAVQVATGVSGFNPSGSSGACSLTEFYDTTTGTDELFIGLGYPGLAGYGADQVTEWNLPVTAGSTPAATADYELGAAILGGASGIVVDNVSTDAQASSIYFGTLATNTSVYNTVGISSISRSTNVVTVNTSSAPAFSPYQVGQNVAIAGVTDSSYDGTFVISAVNSTTQFTYAQIGSNSSSSGGTATAPLPSCGSGNFCAVKLTRSELE